jgi:hypothetical protein
MLADELMQNLPDFRVTKQMVRPSQWDDRLAEINGTHGWNRTDSPVIYKLLGEGNVGGSMVGAVTTLSPYPRSVGDFDAFAKMAKEYYGVERELTATEIDLVVKGNLEASQDDADFEQEDGRQTLCLGIHQAAGALAYQLIWRVAKGEVFGPNTAVEFVLYDDAAQSDRLNGVLMEIEDCAVLSFLNGCCGPACNPCSSCVRACVRACVRVAEDDAVGVGGWCCQTRLSANRSAMHATSAFTLWSRWVLPDSPECEPKCHECYFSLHSLTIDGFFIYPPRTAGVLPAVKSVKLTHELEQLARADVLVVCAGTGGLRSAGADLDDAAVHVMAALGDALEAAAQAGGEAKLVIVGQGYVSLCGRKPPLLSIGDCPHSHTHVVHPSIAWSSC